MKKLKLGFICLVMCLTVFRSSITSFAEPTYTPGVTISENTDYPDTDANYQVTFVYEAASNVKSVSLVGGFTFYTADQEAAYANGEAITYYTPYEYKDGMFPTGYAVSEYGYAPLSMSNVEDNLYEVTIPLPGSQYFYGFQLTYDDGTTATVKDPTNLPLANGDSDSGWSLIYVGNQNDCIEGQEYVYPRTDGKTGTVSYVEYTAIDGSKQPLGIYLPYGYDSSKTYKTIYLSHGGGGNEVEWMNIGSANNIMDNLIAEGEVAEAIIVTMDNTYFSFESGDSLKNIVECIIPYIEENYSVSKKAEDRAMSGLSSGGSVTVQAMLYSNETFAYYGVFSPSRTMDFVKETLTEEMIKTFPNAIQYYISVGIYDSAVRRNVNVQVYEELEKAGANVEFKWKNGAHDWGVWRNQFSEFVKDYLWDVEAKETPITPNPSESDVVTGDTTDIQLLLAMSFLSLTGMGVLVFNKKKKILK